MAERSDGGVSPLRTATCTLGGSKPSSAATSAISPRGLSQVLAHVDGQRPQRRDVDDVGAAAVVARLGGPVATVDGDEEGGQGLAGPGGSRDQGVDARRRSPPSPRPVPGSGRPGTASRTTPRPPGGSLASLRSAGPPRPPPPCCTARDRYPNTCSDATPTSAVRTRPGNRPRWASRALVGQHVAMDLLVVVGTAPPPERLAVRAHHIITVPPAR